MSDTDRQYFTVSEANDHVAHLRELFILVMQLRSQLKTLFSSLEDAGCAPTQEEITGVEEWDDSDVPDGHLRDRRVFAALVETLRENVDRIQELGCIIKDVEAGLVDWYALHEGREVLLCWKFGETEVTHWHEVDGGYDGRRPVAELGEGEQAAG